jgi:hypothetical protein
MVFGGGPGGGENALLAIANDGPVGQYRKALVEELARIDAEEAEAKQRSRNQLAAARNARANGQKLSDSDPMRLMLQMKDDSTV